MDVPSVPSTFRFTARTGELRTIGEIADEDLSGYRSLGSGVGENFILAFYYGTRHCPDFEDRVAGFRIEQGELAATLERDTGRSYLSVRFYELGDPHDAGRSARDDTETAPSRDEVELEDWEWVPDDGAELDLEAELECTVPAEPATTWSGGSVLIGMVVLDGIERRVWRLGFYCRVEGVTDGGIKIPSLIRLVGEEQAAALDHDTFSRWERTVSFPALPQNDVADEVVLRLRCTGPARCRLAVGVPSGRVHGVGAGAYGAQRWALEWFQHVQEFDDGETPLWPFDGAFAAKAGAGAAVSLAATLNSRTGPRGRELADSAGAYARALMG